MIGQIYKLPNPFSWNVYLSDITYMVYGYPTPFSWKGLVVVVVYLYYIDVLAGALCYILI